MLLGLPLKLLTAVPGRLLGLLTTPDPWASVASGGAAERCVVWRMDRVLLRECRGEVEVEGESAPCGVDVPEVGVWGLEVEDGWLPMVKSEVQVRCLR